MVRATAILMILTLFPWAQAGAQEIPASTRTGKPLGRPGFLILVSARDSTSGYHRQDGPGAGMMSLVWEGGQLVVPDTMTLESFGPRDLGVRTTAQLQGSGGAGVLEFRNGSFTVDQPLLLTDGVVSLFVARGQLEIRGAQIRYVPPAASATSAGKKPPDPVAGFLFLAGMVIMILALMRMARLRSRGRKP
ncbi:hypothetical protein COW53_07500 [bacterium CG17_big_fil_post_rev_8_21_14_2_50_64_8]|nr:MAG: hypothetical protein COW53_07500 [bacterium CG17_big_fil_post_rev_8_21_14_2_50_64_8]PJA76227.1 MAG: hypothetical protein CO151_03780 [bacterium CG_4_9_14_3_um_filter_65_15]